ncbi:hypothetical protein E2C01_090662 [Portunus trituberculatus]|uniref:Uncharacterized protein n=1 Tax=Portunus trituberculatus TaxID=210409 RepID=A0A5B7JKS0_PORTR|nr:hypothetical protein [Portunus trituberculatus]
MSCLENTVGMKFDKSKAYMNEWSRDQQPFIMAARIRRGTTFPGAGKPPVPHDPRASSDRAPPLAPSLPLAPGTKLSSGDATRH